MTTRKCTGNASAGFNTSAAACRMSILLCSNIVIFCFQNGKIKVYIVLGYQYYLIIDGRKIVFQIMSHISLSSRIDLIIMINIKNASVTI